MIRSLIRFHFPCRDRDLTSASQKSGSQNKTQIENGKYCEENITRHTVKNCKGKCKWICKSVLFLLGEQKYCKWNSTSLTLKQWKANSHLVCCEKTQKQNAINWFLYNRECKNKIRKWFIMEQNWISIYQFALYFAAYYAFYFSLSQFMKRNASKEGLNI